MPVAPITKACVVGTAGAQGKIIFEVPKGPVLQVGQTVTAAGCTSSIFNGGFAVLANGANEATAASGQTELWSGFTANAPAFPSSPFALTIAGTAAAGNTTYTGTITGFTSAFFAANPIVVITGFTHAAGVNNGTFTFQSGSATTLVVNNASGVLETNTGSAAMFISNIAVETESAAILINNPVAYATTTASVGQIS